MRIVIALGGNAILAHGARGTIEEQRATVARAMVHVARLAARGHELVVTHGNGPQVGRMLLQQRAAAADVPAMPLDVLGAMTQGQLGYLIQQELGAALEEGGQARRVVTLVTQVVVDRDDPAFASPDKPVGPHRTETELEHRRELGDDVGEYRRTSQGTFRRVVASPRPRAVVEVDVVAPLLAAGALPVLAGGGGAPVVRRDDGRLEGVEAVVDKDRTAALIARAIDADALLVLTDVPHVLLDRGTARERAVRELPLDEARAHLADGQFPAGSMGPKVEASCDVAEAGGLAVITSLERAEEALAGTAGTRIVAGTGSR